MSLFFTTEQEAAAQAKKEKEEAAKAAAAAAEAAKAIPTPDYAVGLGSSTQGIKANQPASRTVAPSYLPNVTPRHTAPVQGKLHVNHSAVSGDGYANGVKYVIGRRESIQLLQEFY